jgi:RNA polymerase sigma factor (sigma-70 family)
MSAASRHADASTISPEARELAVTAGHRARIGNTIRRTATRCHLSLSPESTDDLIQDVLLRLWQSGAQEKLETCPAYVRRVAERTVFDTMRNRLAQKRMVRPEARPDIQRLCGKQTRTPEEMLLIREEFRVLVEWCRMQMSARLFQTFCLVHLAGLPRREVGRLVGLSREGVDNALYRARQVLQRKDERGKTITGRRGSHEDEGN